MLSQVTNAPEASKHFVRALSLPFGSNEVPAVLRHSRGGLGLGPTQAEVFGLDYPHSRPVRCNSEGIDISKFVWRLLI
jgi:hypothetical protein